MPRTKSIPRVTKFVPGAYIAADIKRYQEKITPIIPLEMFSAAVREVGEDVRDEIKFSNKAFNALRAGTEDYITDLMRIANELALIDGREMVEPRDLSTAVTEERRQRLRRAREFKKARRQAERAYRKELESTPPPEDWE